MSHRITTTVNPSASNLSMPPTTRAKAARKRWLPKAQSACRMVAVTIGVTAVAACGGGGESGGGAPGGQGGGGVATYIVSTSAGPGGSVSPTSLNVAENSSATFTVAPDTGFELLGVSGCGGTQVGNTYTTNAVTASCTVSATFRPLEVRTSAATSNPGGAIAPAIANALYGDIIDFAIAAEPGFRIAGVSGCGGTLVGAVFSTAPLSADCQVIATFEAASQSVDPIELAQRRPDQETPNLEYILNGLLGCSLPSTCVWRWNYAGPLGSPATVSYSFSSMVNGFPNLPSIDYRDFLDIEKAAIRDVLQRISDITLLDFVETSDITAANSINFVITVGCGGRAGAPPMDAAGAQTPRVVQLGTCSLENLAPEAGQWLWDEIHDIASAKNVIAHEIGHIMGLKHPGNYFGETLPTLSDTEENQFYSTVSYNANSGGGHLTLQAATYQKYDIVALQYLYGIRPQASARTIYNYDDGYDNRPVIHDLTEQGVLDISDTNGDAILNMRPGAFSSFGVNIVSYASDTYGAYRNRPYNNLATTYNTQLQEGRTGPGNDIAYDNALDNTLLLGEGNDIAFLSHGSNVVDGGAGTDVVRYDLPLAEFSVQASVGGVVVEHLVSGRMDSLTSVEFVIFDSVPYRITELCMCSI